MSSELTQAKRKIPPYSAAEIVEQVVGCKWTMRILSILRQGVTRPLAIEGALAGAGPKIVSDRLSKLVELGILKNTVCSQPPTRVEYTFTGFGADFLQVVDQINVLQLKLESSLGNGSCNKVVSLPPRKVAAKQ